MKKVKVYVTLRESVLDPQGSAAKGTLSTMGYNEVEEIRIGKFIEIQINETDRDIDTIVKEMCENLLVNTVIEDYRFEVEEAN